MQISENQGEETHISERICQANWQDDSNSPSNFIVTSLRSLIPDLQARRGVCFQLPTLGKKRRLEHLLSSLLSLLIAVYV